MSIALNTLPLRRPPSVDFNDPDVTTRITTSDVGQFKAAAQQLSNYRMSLIFNLNVFGCLNIFQF